MWELPFFVTTAINILDENGFECYLVGGCVRDHLLDRPVNDYDITTSASVCDLKRIFSSYPQILAGEKHGTVAVIIDNEIIEITTFRTDGVYVDGRHPQNVKFVSSFREDASRRDFTINSIGYHPKTGYKDHYDGIDDIKKRTIRCVGDPESRFDEDALRIMRAVRFSSQLGFTIEEKTSAAVIRKRDNLKMISVERIFEELKKLLMGEYAEDVLNEYMIVLSSVIPELEGIIDYDQQNFHHNLTLSRHTAKVVASLPVDSTLRIAGLFHDISKPDCATIDEKGIKHFRGHPAHGAEKVRDILQRLRCDGKTLEDVYLLIKEHDSDIQENKKGVKRKLSLLGENLFFKLMDLKIADNLAQDPKFLRVDKFERIKNIAREIIADEECFSLKDMKINGNDILSLGYSPSKKIGQCLEYLLDMIIEGEIPNEKEILIAEAKKFMEK